MIDLTFYTQSRLRALRRTGACAVYVIGPKEAYPCKIGSAQNVGARLSELQVGNWVKLYAHHILWIDDIYGARCVEQEAHSQLDEFWQSGEWFTRSADEIRKMLGGLAANPRYRARWHEELEAGMSDAEISKKEKIDRIAIWARNRAMGGRSGPFPSFR